jgi:hypothetical protein
VKTASEPCARSLASNFISASPIKLLVRDGDGDDDGDKGVPTPSARPASAGDSIAQKTFLNHEPRGDNGKLNETFQIITWESWTPHSVAVYIMI